ncbi:hypothetical protein [Actinoplanes cyaneus]|nr:hypothetical protein [Actinoplanes cyaneus]
MRRSAWWRPARSGAALTLLATLAGPSWSRAGEQDGRTARDNA